MALLNCEGPPLSRHDWEAGNEVSNFLFVDDLDVFKVGQLRDPEAVGPCDAFVEGGVVDLLEVGGVVAAFGVDIMGEHVLAVVYAADSGVRVGSAVGVEGGLAKVSREGRVREPASRVVEL